MSSSKVVDLENNNNKENISTITKAELINLRKKLSDELFILNKININVPNFLIIGVQKGGTTWLHENLKNHPQILLPNKKELEFFSYYHKKINENGWSKYLSHINKIGVLIKTRKEPIAIGEVTPSYFWSTNSQRKWTNPPKDFNNNIPGSVFNTLGSKVKLIVCLRNPVDRAISAYLHHVRHNRILPRKEGILEVGHRYGIIDMGFYYQHFQSWLEKFPLDNFKILLYEQNIKNNKESTIRGVCEFLNVDYQLYPNTSNNLEKFHNKGLSYFKENGQIYILDDDNSSPYLAVSADEIKQIKDIYKDDVSNLRNLITVDFSMWNFQ